MADHVGDHTTISRELSEFSLRARPKPVSAYQAGVSELSKIQGTKKIPGQVRKRVEKSGGKQKPQTVDINVNKKRKMTTNDRSLKESKTDKTPTSSSQGQQKGFPIGTVVWGKVLKTRWWPGMVFNGPLAGQDPSADGSYWIFWFGDQKITQMKIGSINIFSKHFFQRCSGSQYPSSKKAILQSIKVCSARAFSKEAEDLKIEDYDSVVENFQTYILQNKDLQDPSFPKEDEPLPAWILSRLEFLKEEGKPSDSVTDDPDKKCFSCRGFYPMICQHPLFKAEICKECKEVMQEALFAMDDDGSDVFCCICGFGSEESVLNVCSSEDCKRSFCSDCLGHYLTKDLYSEVQHAAQWVCVLCKPYQTEKHGLLKPKPDHRTSSLNFLNSFQLQEHQVQTLPAVPDKENREKLRVISIGDGIGTLKLVLDVLNFDIHRYYSSEINENAMLVSSKHHSSSISQIGNVSSIAREKLKSLMPIDLIVFTPPEPTVKDNQDDGSVSAATGDTADERVRILLKCITLVKDLQTVTWDRPFFYLIESTPALPNGVFTAISNILETEPCLYNGEFTIDCPYIKPRLYWTNIPGVHRSAVNQINVKRTDSPIKLDWTDLISNTNANPGTSAPNCSAGAESKESNQDAQRRDNATFLEKTNKLDKIERLMGFPDGYTRIAGLSTQQRAVLVKQTSCPLILTQLLRPLTQFFKCN